MKLDFKNPDSFRVLTRCLLKKDFNLDVELPPDKLVPTLTLRLNYILWLEDIMNTFELKDVHGIDIGCGASCIYPLLAVKLNNWKMNGLEIDEQSINCATENVNRNKLGDRIQIYKQKDENVLSNFVYSNEEEKFTFCMCNPPFYNLNDEASNRTGNRKPPPNSSTGSQNELAVDGGEVQFIIKIIEESIELRNRIQIYTTMVGHKKNVDVILKVLKQHKIDNSITTRFCQGNTTRWGIAWSFNSELALSKIHILVPTSTYPKSTCKPLQAVLFKIEDNQNLNDIKEKVFKIFRNLDLTTNLIESKKFSFIWEISASSNTWSHQRRKKREEARGLLPHVENLLNNKIEEAGPSKRAKLEDNFYKAAISLKLENGEVILQISFLGGSAGKDTSNQILQYIKNCVKNQSL